MCEELASKSRIFSPLSSLDTIIYTHPFWSKGPDLTCLKNIVWGTEWPPQAKVCQVCALSGSSAASVLGRCQKALECRSKMWTVTTWARLTFFGNVDEHARTAQLFQDRWDLCQVSWLPWTVGGRSLLAQRPKFGFGMWAKTDVNFSRKCNREMKNSASK